MDSIFEKINSILSSNSLPSYDAFFEILNEASEILEAESGKDFEYRPLAQDGKCGSLLDFHKDGLPLLVIPDFHARPYFLLNILKYKIFDALILLLDKLITNFLKEKIKITTCK